MVMSEQATLLSSTLQLVELTPVGQAHDLKAARDEAMAAEAAAGSENYFASERSPPDEEIADKFDRVEQRTSAALGQLQSDLRGSSS